VKHCSVRIKKLLEIPRKTASSPIVLLTITVADNDCNKLCLADTTMRSYLLDLSAAVVGVFSFVQYVCVCVAVQSFTYSAQQWSDTFASCVFAHGNSRTRTTQWPARWQYQHSVQSQSGSAQTPNSALVSDSNSVLSIKINRLVALCTLCINKQLSQHTVCFVFDLKLDAQGIRLQSHIPRASSIDVECGRVPRRCGVDGDDLLCCDVCWLSGAIE
jgi:hypothetical protein